MEIIKIKDQIKIAEQRRQALVDEEAGMDSEVDILRKEVARLRKEIELTLKENGHLADGNNCTLIRLKLALL